MSEFNEQSTVAEIVTRRPSTAALFDQLQIDFCCSGDVPLSEAAGKRGLDAQTLLATLNALDVVQGDTAGAHDILDLSSDDLVEHIINEHHERARKQIPMIGELLDTVVRVHGEQDDSLAELRTAFTAVGEAMVSHMGEEEEKLFPICRKIDSEGVAGVEPELLESLMHEHKEVGEGLAAVRKLAGGYDQDQAHCNTHRFLLQSLMEFEEDTHVHIHEENNVLFPRARTALDAASAM